MDPRLISNLRVEQHSLSISHGIAVHCNEIPVFVLTGTDRCAMAALRAYAEAAKQMGCTDEFVEDMECNIIPDFRDFQLQEPDKVKLPD